MLINKSNFKGIYQNVTANPEKVSTNNCKDSE